MDIIYLDNNATTKIDSRVLETMLPFLTEQYANPSSSHLFGRNINEAIKQARQQVANLLSSNSSEIIFTSGATESINIALKGVVENYKNKGFHIVTSSTEHPAVLDTCKYLETIGYEITYLPVKTDGLLDLNLVKQSIRHDTVLVCVMFVNNETGVIQPIKEIAELAHEKGALFMTDGTQAVGKILFNVQDLGIDLLCFSGHKMHGPKGVGALYVNSSYKIKISEQTHGGKQEKGIRSGTLNVPGIIGLGMACSISQQEIHKDKTRIIEIRDYFENEVLKIEDTFLNGSRIERLHNVSNICFRGITAESIIEGLKNIMVSSGSACSSSIQEPSHVLKAMGLEEDAFSSVRFSLSRFNTKEEIETVLTGIKKLITQLRTTAIV